MATCGSRADTRTWSRQARRYARNSRLSREREREERGDSLSSREEDPEPATAKAGLASLSTSPTTHQFPRSDRPARERRRFRRATRFFRRTRANERLAKEARTHERERERETSRVSGPSTAPNSGRTGCSFRSSASSSTTTAVESPITCRRVSTRVRETFGEKSAAGCVPSRGRRPRARGTCPRHTVYDVRFVLSRLGTADAFQATRFGHDTIRSNALVDRSKIWLSRTLSIVSSKPRHPVSPSLKHPT